MSAQAAEIPHVDLSANNPKVQIIDATHWRIPIPRTQNQSPNSPQWFCNGTYINPEIVSLGTNGTAVYYGTKYTCDEPVSYSITAGVYFVVNPGEYEDAGSTYGSGVSATPYVDRVSVACANNQNGGWVPYDESNLNGEPHGGEGNQTTVGCRI